MSGVGENKSLGMARRSSRCLPQPWSGRPARLVLIRAGSPLHDRCPARPLEALAFPGRSNRPAGSIEFRELDSGLLEQHHSGAGERRRLLAAVEEIGAHLDPRARMDESSLAREMPSESAARMKCSSSATATKRRRWVIFTQLGCRPARRMSCTRPARSMAA
jgi:hypothetical protein